MSSRSQEGHVHREEPAASRGRDEDTTTNVMGGPPGLPPPSQENTSLRRTTSGTKGKAARHGDRDGTFHPTPPANAGSMITFHVNDKQSLPRGPAQGYDYPPFPVASGLFGSSHSGQGGNGGLRSAPVPPVNFNQAPVPQQSHHQAPPASVHQYEGRPSAPPQFLEPHPEGHPRRQVPAVPRHRGTSGPPHQLVSAASIPHHEAAPTPQQFYGTAPQHQLAPPTSHYEAGPAPQYPQAPHVPQRNYEAPPDFQRRHQAPLLHQQAPLPPQQQRKCAPSQNTMPRSHSVGHSASSLILSDSELMPPPPPSAPASFLGKGDGASADGSVMSSVSKVNSKRKFSEIDTAMFDDVLDNCIVSIFFHFVDLRVLTPLFKQVDQATMGDMKSRMVVLKRNIKKLETQAKKAAETYLEAQAELAMMVYELFKWRKGLIGFRSHDVEEVDNDGKKEYFSMNLPITYSQSQDRGVGSSSNGHQAGACCRLPRGANAERVCERLRARHHFVGATRRQCCRAIGVPRCGLQHPPRFQFGQKTKVSAAAPPPPFPLNALCARPSLKLPKDMPNPSARHDTFL